MNQPEVISHTGKTAANSQKLRRVRSGGGRRSRDGDGGKGGDGEGKPYKISWESEDAQGRERERCCLGIKM